MEITTWRHENAKEIGASHTVSTMYIYEDGDHGSVVQQAQLDDPLIFTTFTVV